MAEAVLDLTVRVVALWRSTRLLHGQLLRRKEGPGVLGPLRGTSKT